MMVQAWRQTSHIHRHQKTEGKVKVQRPRGISDNAGESDNVNDEMHRKPKPANSHRKNDRT